MTAAPMLDNWDDPYSLSQATFLCIQLKNETAYSILFTFLLGIDFSRQVL
jgi:hypothetical protein